MTKEGRRKDEGRKRNEEDGRRKRKKMKEDGRKKEAEKKQAASPERLEPLQGQQEQNCAAKLKSDESQSREARV